MPAASAYDEAIKCDESCRLIELVLCSSGERGIAVDRALSLRCRDAGKGCAAAAAAVLLRWNADRLLDMVVVAVLRRGDWMMKPTGSATEVAI